MPLRCTYNRILVKPDPDTRKTPGGIELPDHAVPKSRVGTVVNVGPGRPDYGTIIPCCVKEGDRVIFNRNVAIPVKINEEEFILMSDSEAVGVVEGDDVKSIKVGADAANPDMMATQL